MALKESGEKVGSSMGSSANNEEEIFKEEKCSKIVCNMNDCGRSFFTYFGLERHLELKHQTFKPEKEESVCQICNKKVIYLGQHIRAKHSDVQKQVCEVCLLEVNVNMQKHRKSCIKCRFCDYENHKKARLLNHIDV